MFIANVGQNKSPFLSMSVIQSELMKKLLGSPSIAAQKANVLGEATIFWNLLKSKNVADMEEEVIKTARGNFDLSTVTVG